MKRGTSGVDGAGRRGASHGNLDVTIGGGNSGFKTADGNNDSGQMFSFRRQKLATLDASHKGAPKVPKLNLTPNL